MKYNLNDEVILNLKDKLDALIEKGNKLSRNLSVDEQYSIMKRVISDGIDKALQNIYKNQEIKFTEQELNEKMKELDQFVQEYFNQKFSEIIAKDWEKNR
jgi:hypothetical protein